MSKENSSKEENPQELGREFEDSTASLEKMEKMQGAMTSVLKNVQTIQEVIGGFLNAFLIFICLPIAVWSMLIKADWQVTLGFLFLPYLNVVLKILVNWKK